MFDSFRVLCLVLSTEPGAEQNVLNKLRREWRPTDASVNSINNYRSGPEPESGSPGPSERMR